RSLRFFQIVSGSNTTTDVDIIRADDVPRLYAGEDVDTVSVFSREAGVEYSADHAAIDGRDWIYLPHHQGAEDPALAPPPPHDPQAEPEGVSPHRPGVRLEDVDCLRDYAIVEYREGGIARMGILDYATHEVREIAFDEPLFTAGSA